MGVTSHSMKGAQPQTLSDAVVRTIREPLLILDAELRVQAANPAFYRAFRTDPEATVGSLLYELGEGQWAIPVLRELLEHILPQDVAVEDFEVSHEFRELGLRHMLLNARRLEASGEGQPLILLAILDVTERIQTQRDLERSNQELERFAYVASHDLQEPLRMVASYTRLLARRYEGRLDERADKYIRYAAEGAERMKTLIQDLLAYSRVGTQAGDPVPTDPDRVLDEVVRDFALRIRETGARLKREPLPRVRVDPGQLRQLFQNLLENAFKFSDGKPPEVQITGSRDGAWTRITVQDAGVGIDPEYFERVFLVFQRLHGRDIEGTGIGLALCRRIVEHHGGRLWVESEPGRGATFHFTLPASEVE